MAINPVAREIWNLEGLRLARQKMKVIKLHDETCKANCFLMRHNSSGPTIVRDMYCKRGKKKKWSGIQDKHIRWIKRHLGPFLMRLRRKSLFSM